MRARHRTLTLRLAFLAAAFACLLLVRPEAYADDATPASEPEVRVTTNMGTFVIELYPDRAPLTVADFLNYVRAGFYTNTLFHRVVANFVIQGGGHDASPPYALKPTQPPVDNESGNGLQNKRGAVGLARAAGPHTGNAQFYVNLVDNPELDPLPTRWGYAIFGQVVQGMDVIDRIGVVATGAFGPFKADAPLKPVIIQSIEVITPPGLSAPPASTPPATPPAGAPPAGTPPSGASASGASPSGTPASGTSPSGTPPSGTSQSGASQSGSQSSQPPAGSPPAQPGKSGQTPAPSGAKPATPPPGTPPGEADQPDGTSPLR